MALFAVGLAWEGELDSTSSPSSLRVEVARFLLCKRKPKRRFLSFKSNLPWREIILTI